MAGTAPLITPHAHYLTPSPQEFRRFFPEADDMGDADTVTNGISRSSTNAPTSADTTTTRPRGTTQGRQKLVFTDPVAFRYLEEDPDTIVLDRRRRLEGYELYIVEQWACSRTHPTFLICTYTGDTSRSVIINVLSVPSDSATWSPRLRLYFDAMSQYHAKPKETPYGDIMVTNLAGFPATLTVIAVPDGDVRKHREDFIVNEDLKRMNCAGRGAMNVQPPQQSTVAKFHQLYRTSESIGIYQAVMELVKLCQKALLIYGRLQEAYTDGLLCDITEKAIADWWTEVGVYFYNIEPGDGILGPTTVAALLGLLIGANNRLKAYGAPVGKDIFDIPSMKRAIGSFQKAAKLERTRRLDLKTLDKLHRATAKTASGEGWTVSRAVKGTLAEVSGKGGEMVMGIVGGKDKAGISEVETLDIDRFAQLVVGPRMKWLWLGKSKPVEVQREANEGAELKGQVFSTDDQGGFIWTSNKRDSVAHGLERSDTANSLAPHSATEGRSGLGRIREAVGGKLHNQRPGHEREDTALDFDSNNATPSISAVSSNIYQRPTTPANEEAPPLGLALKEASSFGPARQVSPRQATGLRPGMVRSATDHRVPSYRKQLAPAPLAESPRKREIASSLERIRRELQSPKYVELNNLFENYSGPQAPGLRRSRSAVHTVGTIFENFPRQNRPPTPPSPSSIVETSVLTFPDVILAEPPLALNEQKPNDNTNAANKPNGTTTADSAAPTKPPPTKAELLTALSTRTPLLVSAQKRHRRITQVTRGLIPYTEDCVSHVESLDRAAGANLSDLNTLYYAKLEEYQTQRATSGDVVSNEKGMLGESGP
ncbi:Protein STB2 [Cyphellophora attinorum]|uniref:Protein STB2 n=1 Tax=Cyphellophora attinorum TaxID=1664694 RepID=A0A0N1HZZ0_9EURO|nr:Protein STB2 [Phialophora attinorum]KPI44545.1 Protein STB2 [Phialophora attinorum]